MIKSGLAIFKSTVNWFKNEKANQQVIILLFAFVFLLLVVSGFVVKNYFDYKNDTEAKFTELNAIIKKCDDKTLKINNLEKKIIQQQALILLINATNDYNPNAMWLTDLNGVVKWVNKAYVKKYLKKKGKTAFDLVGTDGTDIFGAIMAKAFKDNNDIVYMADKPITFNEFISTTKFPVYVNKQAIFIGGMEYEIFEE